MSEIIPCLLYRALHLPSSILFDTQPWILWFGSASGAVDSNQKKENTEKKKDYIATSDKMLCDLFPSKGTITFYVLEKAGLTPLKNLYALLLN